MIFCVPPHNVRKGGRKQTSDRKFEHHRSCETMDVVDSSRSEEMKQRGDRQWQGT